MHLVRIVAAAAIVAAALCAAPQAPASGSSVVPVELVRTEEGYRLLRGGEPYQAMGAGIDGLGGERLAANGGNSFRSWRDQTKTDGQLILDEAARHGLTVAMCIPIGRERHGFDYDDEEAVAAQLEYARGEVMKYKDHPALLAWIIGNEPNLEFKNPKIFNAINDISEMIKEVDGNHPTTTALAGFGPELARLIETRAPDLDFVSIQMYGDLVNLPRKLREAAYEGPYMVTEWGPIGHWEVSKTAWGAPIEHTSSEKARFMRRAYDEGLAVNPDKLLGYYVFMWGQKQERTPTWYGVFLADGSETEAVDVMHFLWNGEWPDNQAPRIEDMRLDGGSAHDDVTLDAGAAYPALLSARDPDGDALKYRWEIMRESATTKTGGDKEQVPETMHGLIQDPTGAQVNLKAPAEPGAYRLFAYVYDGRGKAGHANIPFLVREPASD